MCDCVFLLWLLLPLLPLPPLRLLLVPLGKLLHRTAYEPVAGLMEASRSASIHRVAILGQTKGPQETIRAIKAET